MRRTAALALLLGACNQEEPIPCPMGETCSDQFPVGFRGSALGDGAQPGAILSVAVGGRETIVVLESPDSDVGLLAFRVASTGTAITTGQLVPPNVTVVGNSAGSSFLRILEPTPGTDRLLGRTQIDVAAIASVDLVPRDNARDESDEEFALDPTEWVLLAGKSTDVVVRVFDAAGDRLADEAMFLGVAGPPLSLGAQPSWDTVSLSATTSSTATGTLRIKNGDNVDRDQPIDVVSDIDSIVWVPARNATQNPSVAVRAGRAVTYCFRAVAGGKLVAGLGEEDWVPATANITVAVLRQAPNCFTLQGNAPGTGLLTVAAAAQAPATFTLTFQ